ncbi:hypothetical protein LTR56_007321 [Elasticomyces elasticus]|nr:hypothetical protein LTR56_007321 [Elasticomyces elasticus]KAK5742268.1 hypothetical protein LTS12_024308 [Elasticomyces elasticus]
MQLADTLGSLLCPEWNDFFGFPECHPPPPNGQPSHDDWTFGGGNLYEDAGESQEPGGTNVLNTLAGVWHASVGERNGYDDATGIMAGFSHDATLQETQGSSQPGLPPIAWSEASLALASIDPSVQQVGEQQGPWRGNGFSYWSLPQEIEPSEGVFVPSVGLPAKSMPSTQCLHAAGCGPDAWAAPQNIAKRNGSTTTVFTADPYDAWLATSDSEDLSNLMLPDTDLDELFSTDTSNGNKGTVRVTLGWRQKAQAGAVIEVRHRELRDELVSIHLPRLSPPDKTWRGESDDGGKTVAHESRSDTRTGFGLALQAGSTRTGEEDRIGAHEYAQTLRLSRLAQSRTYVGER